MKIDNFFAELKRRNVYKVAVAYAVVGWLLIQIATQVFPFFEIPNWAVRLIVLAIVVGFPIALVMAWAFELTPENSRSFGSRQERTDRPSGASGSSSSLCVVPRFRESQDCVSGFFRSLENADPDDVPIVKEAKGEYAKLQ